MTDEAAGPLIPGVSRLAAVARGRLATRYRGREDGADRPVAVTVYETDLGTGGVAADRQRRFDTETARLVALSGQAGIAAVYSGGVLPDGRPYLVGEFCPGGSLQERLTAHGPLPVADVVEVGARVAGALRAAHRTGLVHRNVTPASVLVRASGEPVLADFALSLEAEQQARAGLAALTPEYAAPESLSGGEYTPAADTYCLGVTLYALLTGAPPFEHRPDEDPMRHIHRVLTDPVPPIRRADVPPRLTGLLLRTLSRRPHERPVDDLVADGLAGLTPRAGGTADRPPGGPGAAAAAAAAAGDADRPTAGRPEPGPPPGAPPSPGKPAPWEPAPWEPARPAAGSPGSPLLPPPRPAPAAGGPAPTEPDPATSPAGWRATGQEPAGTVPEVAGGPARLAGSDPWASEPWPTDTWSALAPPPPAEPWVAEQAPAAPPAADVLPWAAGPAPAAPPAADGPPWAGEPAPPAADVPPWAGEPAPPAAGVPPWAGEPAPPAAGVPPWAGEPAPEPAVAPSWLPPPRSADPPWSPEPTPATDPAARPAAAPAPPTRRPARRGIAVLLGAVVLVAAVVVAAILVANRPKRSAPAAAGPTASAPAATGTPTGPGTPTGTAPTASPSPPASSAGTPAPTGPAVPAGFRQVTGERGVTTAVPADWTVKPGLVPQDREADDPHHADRFVRFGGYVATARTELDRVLAIEHTVKQAAGVRDYRRLRMQSVRYGTATAVDWEFTFTSGGQRRHSFGRYWRFGASDYVVYASAPDADWAQLRPIVAVLLQTGGPH